MINTEHHPGQAESTKCTFTRCRNQLSSFSSGVGLGRFSQEEGVNGRENNKTLVKNRVGLFNLGCYFWLPKFRYAEG